MILPSRKIHHIFISYFAKEMDAVFTSLMMNLVSMGFNVFNQKSDLAGVDVNLEVMQEHAAGSVLVLALLSPNYFTSKWCRGEVEGAAAAGVPIVPIFSGDHYTYTQMTDLMKKGSQKLDDPEKAAAVKAAFGQNLIDVNNAQHVAKCSNDLREKIIRRFLVQGSTPQQKTPNAEPLPATQVEVAAAPPVATAFPTAEEEPETAAASTRKMSSDLHI
jgi:hypothetical protein